VLQGINAYGHNPEARPEKSRQNNQGSSQACAVGQNGGTESPTRGDGRNHALTNIYSVSLGQTYDHLVHPPAAGYTEHADKNLAGAERGRVQQLRLATTCGVWPEQLRSDF